MRRLFIANRGEIAVRILRTARAEGIEVVLGVSTADRESLPAMLADRVVVLGPASAKASYLNIPAVLQAAAATGCDALHPGYGFLSENRNLAIGCAEAGLIFIGPTPENLGAVGDKLTARGHAVAAGVPVVPGGMVTSLSDAQALAATLGYPLLLKAVAGGGGKGMKRVDNDAELPTQLSLAMTEAESAFGDARVYLERYVTSGRHIEVQIVSDGTRVLHAGERDCSVQRRYQKLVEEAPAPGLPPDLRAALQEAAMRFARHIGYRSLGTVEFLVDVERGTFYFLEMNARIQVEHPVTEAVTGLDLVALQLAIARGETLPDTLPAPQGHAIELRLNAEDPVRGFAPSPGRAREVWFPALPGLRVDTHMQPGAMISPHYDSMVAKLIAHGPDRASALRTLETALRLLRVRGIATNSTLHQRILADPEFRAGGVDTRFLTGLMARLTGDTP